ncbi:MAG: DNA gyrase inhibitor YacG [Azospirillum sp.]|nr:DNA gyrase inhibitor YacG [Azospirillum sp.]
MTATEKPCPICGRPALAEFRRFCSRRCANVDLSRWLGGVYRVPADDQPEDEPEPE